MPLMLYKCYCGFLYTSYTQEMRELWYWAKEKSPTLASFCPKNHTKLGKIPQNHRKIGEFVGKLHTQDIHRPTA